MTAEKRPRRWAALLLGQRSLDPVKLHVLADLGPDEVKALRRRFRAGESAEKLARETGLSVGAVRLIVGR